MEKRYLHRKGRGLLTPVMLVVPMNSLTSSRKFTAKYVMEAKREHTLTSCGPWLTSSVNKYIFSLNTVPYVIRNDNKRRRGAGVRWNNPKCRVSMMRGGQVDLIEM